jgi:uncharacterized ferritin-like protein (DUF455 family)
MSDAAQARPPLDPAVLADGPARDSRFEVVERWIECANFPATDPHRKLEFFHRQMNEEVDSLECCARNLCDFPDEDWSLRMGMARQCADEARHAAMFRRIFEARGGRVGEYPVINFQYRIVTRIPSLAGRLAVQNRSFEAGGLDAISFGIGDAQQEGDAGLVALFDAQYADEIGHVRFANLWIRTLTERNPINVMRIAQAMGQASKAFSAVMGPEATAGVDYPADVAGRQEAGFTDREIQVAMSLQNKPSG